MTDIKELAQRALQDDTSGPGMVARLVTMWSLIGITSWADFAAFLGAVYTLVLLLHYLWKHFIRPFCERRGWIERKKRRKTDSEET